MTGRDSSALFASLCSPAPDKPALRRHFRALRRASVAAALPAMRAVALDQLPAWLSGDRALGLYWPVGSEPDLEVQAPAGLARLLPGRLALPAVLPARPGEPQGRLVYLPWEPGSTLQPDACGIPSPPLTRGAEPLPPSSLGLLLVPALACDRTGIRLGSGGGWYDRLRADPAWRAVPALAVLPSACVVDRLPRDAWDVPFSGWLDETGLWSSASAP